MFKKIVLITRKRRLEELIERFNTRSQAKFYIEHAGGDFADYERARDTVKRGHMASRSYKQIVESEKALTIPELDGSQCDLSYLTLFSRTRVTAAPA